MKRKRAMELKAICQEEHEVKNCKDCANIYECSEYGWEMIEAHRHKNGRFGKIYEE